MCGIAGIVSLDGRPVAAGDLERLAQALVHRGPDGEGVYHQEGIGLVHRRLAVIDPQGGRQPMRSPDGRLVLTYNGEIYNYREIRAGLEPDYSFRTDSDTEVLLAAFQRWGIACLERLRGMFAFALYDAAQKELYLVRDRVGIKPLYYHLSPAGLSFASELSALLRLKAVPREIDPSGLINYFRYQYLPTPSTIYRHVRKLEAGHYLRLDLAGGRVEKKRYWHLTLGRVERTEAEWLDELNRLLDETMGLYVLSDVPFGAFLSGGVDSSLVTALMSRHLPRPVRTFSLGFKEEKHSELPFAAQAGRSLKTDHHQTVLPASLALEVLEGLVEHFGEPFGDSSAIPTYLISREAARKVKMVLSGDGGDELFGGYQDYRETWADLQRPPGLLLPLLSPFLARYGPLRRIRRLGLDPQRKHDSHRTIFDDPDLERLFGPGVELPPPERGSFDLAGEEVDPVTRFQAQDFKTFLADDVLTKVDRMSMACSLEVRVPLLDHRLVELAFSLPLELKLRPGKGGTRSKYLLKQSAARFLPWSLLDRPKMGFGIPLVEWCRGPLRPFLQDSLHDPAGPIFDWLDRRYVVRTLNWFLRGHDGLAARIWLLFIFHLWLTRVHRSR